MDKMEFTRENFVSLYTSCLALEAQVDILRQVLFGAVATLEKSDPSFVQALKAHFYDCWGEELEKRIAFHIPPAWAQSQYDNEASLHLKRIHDLMLEAEEGR
jgi:hypothetical protein